jgi:hypothetical protein
VTDQTQRSQCAALLVLAALALVAACGGDKAIGPKTPSAVPGTLAVRLTTPNADDAAIVVTITGPAAVSSVAASLPGAVVHSRTVAGTTRVAVFGALATGELLHFTVPDVNAAAQFSVQIAEVSDRVSALRSSTAGYTATVAGVP